MKRRRKKTIKPNTQKQKGLQTTKTRKKITRRNGKDHNKIKEGKGREGKKHRQSRHTKQRTNGQGTSTTATSKKEHKTAQTNIGQRTQTNHKDKFTNRIGRDKGMNSNGCKCRH